MTANDDADDLQTLSTAAIRQGHSGSGAGAGTEGGEETDGSSSSLVRSPPPPSDPRDLLDALFESLTMEGNPGLQVESAHAIVAVVDQFVHDVQGVAIPALMGLLKSDDESARAKAEDVVRAIVNSESEDRRNWLLGPMVRGIMGNDPELQFKGTYDIASILFIQEDAPVQKVVDTGIVPRLIEFLKRTDHPDLQFEAAGALGCIAKRSPHRRDLLLQSGVMPPLVALTAAAIGSSHKLRVNAPGAVGMLVAAKPRPPLEPVLPALHAVARLIYDNDERVVAMACWALNHFALVDVQVVIDAGVCRRIVTLLRHQSPAIQETALLFVGNFVCGSIEQVQEILRHHPLPSFRTILESSNSLQHELVCWSLNNLVLGREDQIQAVIDARIVPFLIRLLGSSSSEPSVRSEAAWAVAYITEIATVVQVEFLVARRCIPALCSALSVVAPEGGGNAAAPEVELVSYALEGLANILHVGWKISNDAAGAAENPMAVRLKAGGRAKLKELRRHPFGDIRRKACDLLRRYFNIGEDDDTDADAHEAEGVDGNGDGM